VSLKGDIAKERKKKRKKERKKRKKRKRRKKKINNFVNNKEFFNFAQNFLIFAIDHMGWNE